MDLYKIISKRIKKSEIMQNTFKIEDPVYGEGCLDMHSLLKGLNWNESINVLSILRDEGKIKGFSVSPNIIFLNDE